MSSEVIVSLLPNKSPTRHRSPKTLSPPLDLPSFSQIIQLEESLNPSKKIFRAKLIMHPVFLLRHNVSFDSFLSIHQALIFTELSLKILNPSKEDILNEINNFVILVTKYLSSWIIVENIKPISKEDNLDKINNFVVFIIRNAGCRTKYLHTKYLNEMKDILDKIINYT